MTWRADFEKVRPLLPGLLAYFNIADAKRRNSHLGYMVLDEDIAEFHKLLTDSADVAVRNSGDSWLAFYKDESVLPIESILKAMHREQPISIGWKSEGYKGDEHKSIEQTVSSVIVRAFRCLYLPVKSMDDVDKAIEEFPKEYWSLPVSVAIPFEERSTFERKRWSCVTEYPVEDPSCPFCAGRQFDWEDGDSHPYKGYGTCKNCSAQVSMKGLEKLD